MIFTSIWDMWYWKVWFDLIWFDLIWFDLIWFDLIRHSKPHWKQHSLRRLFILPHCRFASNKYFSISFLFSRFRCSCSRKCHSKNVVLWEVWRDVWNWVRKYSIVGVCLFKIVIVFNRVMRGTFMQASY